MKNFLFSVVLCIAAIQFVNAQVIELKGMGTLGADPATITFNEFDLGSIEKVVVEATAIISNGDVDQKPEAISFSDADESHVVPFNYVKKHYSVASMDPSFKGDHKGYYTAVFNTVDAAGITLDNKIGVLAFYAYIYLSDGSLNVYSMLNRDEVPAFLHAMGPNYTVLGEFMLSPYDGLRNATIKVPLSDNETIDDDQRKGVVTFYTNGVPVMEESVIFELNQAEKNFHIEELTLNNIPPEVDKVTVGVYSLDGRGIGDSFFAGKFLLTVEELEPGCTLTQGYWKTHSLYGPAPYDDTWAMLTDGADTEFFTTGMSWYDVFGTPVKGNVYYQLAHQYMAAHLNMLNDAWVPEEVSDAMTDAESVLANGPADYEKHKGKTTASKSEIQWLVSLASTLASYNEGYIGPGHCDDTEEEYEKSAQIKNEDTVLSDLKVYPNPVIHSAVVSFEPISDGRATVDLYNSIGQRLSRLMDRNVQTGMPVSFSFNGQEYNEGLYILRVQNGTGAAATRIQVGR